jgi:hypothetical protein
MKNERLFPIMSLGSQQPFEGFLMSFINQGHEPLSHLTQSGAKILLSPILKRPLIVCSRAHTIMELGFHDFHSESRFNNSGLICKV